MTGRLDGKVAIVTGAGQGIGRAIALLMAEQGARVVVNDIGAALDGAATGEAPADEVVRAIREAGGEAIANRDSVADWDGAHRLVASAVDVFGTLDIVVNNAGILRDAMFHKMTREQWDAVIGVHLNGTFNVSRAAADHFRANQRGVYVHMTSSAGLHGNVGQGNYAAAKLGVTALSKVIALEMQRFGVRSNCIAPAAATRMTESIRNIEGYSERLLKMPTRSIAVLAAYLASDAASAISGQVLGARGNEIFLYNQARLARTLHCGDGWTIDMLDEVMAGMMPLLEPLAGAIAATPWHPM